MPEGWKGRTEKSMGINCFFACLVLLALQVIIIYAVHVYIFIYTRTFHTSNIIIFPNNNISMLNREFFPFPVLRTVLLCLRIQTPFHAYSFFIFFSVLGSFLPIIKNGDIMPPLYTLLAFLHYLLVSSLSLSLSFSLSRVSGGKPTKSTIKHALHAYPCISYRKRFEYYTVQN